MFNQFPAVYVSRLIDLYNVVHADSFAWFAISQEIKTIIINHVFYQHNVNVQVSVIEVDEQKTTCKHSYSRYGE